MKDAFTGPEQQIEQTGLRPEESAELERRIAKAGPAGGDAPSASQSEQQQLKSAVADRQYGDKVEATSKIQNAEIGKQYNTFDSAEQRAKVDAFSRDFVDIPGAESVRQDALGANWSKRAGADHHMDVARELGSGEIRAFEEEFHPNSTGGRNRVDIVTKDDVAIECKTAWGDEVSPSTIRSAHAQALRRLEPNAEGRAYKGTIVVVPDGKLAGEAAKVAQQYEARGDGVRFIEVSRLRQTLSQMRQRKW